MKRVLGTRAQAALEAAEDGQDLVNAAAEARGAQPNLSFFAFTATPKGKTIELFGRPGPSGKPEPFHVYSMRQAIEERFILDVLQRYIDYDTYYRIVKAVEDDPEFPKRRASVALGKFLSLHPVNVGQRTEVIIEHFRDHVRPLMEGRAKAMVVTSSRLHAVRYMQAFERYLDEHGYTDIRPLVAFSGTVLDPDTGEEFTEPGMNTDVVTGKSISESALPARFDSPDYQILLVAEKYQTGFDQPLLQAMYVDKRLDGVQAVQTLSRLNRIAPGKAPPFVLDFVNDPENIRDAFAPYYDRTELLETSDPYHLEELKHELDGTQVYFHERGRGVREGVLPASRRSSPRVSRPRAHGSAATARPRPLHRARRGGADGLPRPPRRVREPLRLPQPDHPLRRQPPRTPLLVRPRCCSRTCEWAATAQRSTSATT